MLQVSNIITKTSKECPIGFKESKPFVQTNFRKVPFIPKDVKNPVSHRGKLCTIHISGNIKGSDYALEAVIRIHPGKQYKIKGLPYIRDVSCCINLK